MSSRMFCVTDERQATGTSFICSPIHPIRPNHSSQAPLSSFRRSLTFWNTRQVQQSRWANTLPGQLCSNFCMLLRLSPPRHLPFPRTWLSSHCQVCLIPSCLTRCYLEPRLSGTLNPFVTHDNKKLGRRSLSGDWEEDRWTSAEVGREEGAFALVQGNSGELATVFFPRTGLQISFIATVEEEPRTKSYLPPLFWQSLWAFVINLGAIPCKIGITTVTMASRWLEMKIWEEAVRNRGVLHDAERKNWRHSF